VRTTKIYAYATYELVRGFTLGRIEKGEKCSVLGCGNSAVRSIGAGKVTSAGLKIDSEKRAYLCKEHYKEFKKATRKERTLERWRQRDSY
jgi:hypothetical protein